jgi:hypothetical protein
LVIAGHSNKNAGGPWRPSRGAGIHPLPPGISRNWNTGGTQGRAGFLFAPALSCEQPLIITLAEAYVNSQTPLFRGFSIEFISSTLLLNN